MKKLICFILIACTLMLTFNISSYAMQNKIENGEYEYRFEVLRALGFLDEKFVKDNADGSVTREQALDAIIKLCSFGTDSIQISEEYTYFPDVLPDSEYFESVVYGVESRIVTGNKGNFGPERPITAMEAVTFVMRASGYREYAEVNGGYPTGYIQAANRCGLNYFGTESMTQAEFVSLLFRAMLVPVYEQTEFGESISFEENGDTILSFYHDIYKVRGQVTANFVSSLTQKKIHDKNALCIDDIEYHVKNGEYSSLLGCYVNAYYKKTEGRIPEILFMSEDTSYDSLVLPADEITGFSDLKYRYGEERTQYANIAARHNLIINGVRLTDYTEADFIPSNGYVMLVGKNKIYDTIIINTFQSYHVQSLAVGIAQSISVTDFETLRRFEIELNSEKSVEVYVDNEKVDMEPFSYTVKGEEYQTYTFVGIPEGSSCSIFSDKYENRNGWIIPAQDAKVVRVYVYTPKLMGECTAYGNDFVEINGAEYEIATQNQLSGLKAGDSGYFLFDYDGKLFARYDNRYYGNISYAYLINAKTDGAFDTVLKLKLMTDQGKIKEYTIEDRVLLNGTMKKDLSDVYDELRASARLLDSTFTISQPVKIRLDENGKLAEIQTVTNLDTESKMVRATDRGRYSSRSDSGFMLYSGGVAHYLEPRVMFEVPTTETFVDEDYRIMVGWPDYETKTIDIFDVNVHRVPELIVSYAGRTEHTLSKPLVMVSKIVTALDEDGNIVSELVGYDGFDKVYYYSENLSLFNGVKEGDVLKVYGRGDEVTRWEYVVKIDDVKAHDYSSDHGRQSTGLYEVYALNGDQFTLQHDEFIDAAIGKRESQIGFLWTTDSHSFTNGAVYYDGNKGGDRVSACKVNSGVPNVIQSVRNVGNDECTKIYISMQNGMIKFVALYNGL